MTQTFKRSVPLSLALAATLLAGGCHSNTAPQQSQQQPDQSQPAPNQPAQQAVNPGAGAAPTQSGSPDRDRERRSYEKGYAAAQRQQQAGQQRPAQQSYPTQPPQAAYAPAPPPPQQRTASVIPAGTHIVVTLGQTVSSKNSQPGDSFTATVAEPVVVGGTTLIRAGAPASGTVVDAKAMGHFKGGAELAIRLDSVRADGRTYQVASSTVERAEQGKGKRTAALTGGGGGLGAIIGGLAGGGKGALIGGLAGAGAGGAGSAFTGNKDLVIPAETSLTFRLERDVPLN